MFDIAYKSDSDSILVSMVGSGTISIFNRSLELQSVWRYPDPAFNFVGGIAYDATSKLLFTIHMVYVAIGDGQWRGGELAVFNENGIVIYRANAANLGRVPLYNKSAFGV